jgi:hypothetical protein
LFSVWARLRVQAGVLTTLSTQHIILLVTSLYVPQVVPLRRYRREETQGSAHRRLLCHSTLVGSTAAESPFIREESDRTPYACTAR